MLKRLRLDRPLLLAARSLLYAWVRTQVLPQPPASIGIDPARPVVYVLNRRFLSSLLVLSRETEAAGIKPALAPLNAGALQSSRSFFFLSRPEPWFGTRKPSYSQLLQKLAAAAHADPSLDVQLVPVSVLWGRAPDKENSIWKLLFADNWAVRGKLRRLFTVALHGKHTLVRFSPPLSLRAIADEAGSEELTLRKASRLLRNHLRRQREMAIGPDLSHRRTQFDALLESPAVQAAIEAEARAQAQAPAAGGKGRDESALLRRAQRTARSYAWEIASDYSYPFIRIMYRLLTWLWTRIYDGVEIANLDTATGMASDHEIVYVPCHRSHIDYLLLSYIVFNEGLVVPHIAAGANLNLPGIGNFLRRGGAFFLRRSFKGNRLYAAVFNEYLHMMIAKGFPIEYFVEGGRSRTGRLLAPKAGMLSMTVQSFLRDSERPIVFLPVYIGYEKLFEGRTYIGELMGKPKKKESVLDLLLALRELRKNFGKVHVNFGEPIHLADVLAAAHPGWRDEPLPGEGRPEWLAQGIAGLMQHIADGINSAAVVHPVSLASLALLAAPRRAMDEQQLVHQIDGYRQLALNAPYAPRAGVTALDGAGVVAYCERLNMIRREKHALGDVLMFVPEEAVLATYARNNVLHLFALPGLIACLLAQNVALERLRLRRLAHTVYPFLRAELSMRWTDEELDGELERSAAAMADLGWMSITADGRYRAPEVNSEEYAQLALLGKVVRPTLVRYFITLAMLTQRGSGVLTAAELESLCHLQAQRLSLLSEFDAPEFFDKAVFATFADTLTGTGMAEIGEDGRILFDVRLKEAAGEARYVLPPEVRQTIVRLTRRDASATEEATASEASKPVSMPADAPTAAQSADRPDRSDHA